MSSIIRVTSLFKSFGDFTAVDGISFDVEQGELFAFLGPNGAGKSTTISILCTLMRQSAGTVEICGLRAGKDDSLIRRKIGVVFQENCMDNLLTVRQNLVLRAYLYESDGKRVKAGLDKACSVLDIGDLLDRPLYKLSGGQKRRCEIARALMNSPEILFLDEPSTGLDPQTRHNVWDCVEHLRREHKITVFLTTHYMEEAAGADSIAIIDGGKVVARGTPAELKGKYSNDLLRLETVDRGSVKARFKEMRIDYQEKPDSICVKLPDSLAALDILKTLERYVSAFEVVHGTMDDVFLNITGKSLRED